MCTVQCVTRDHTQVVCVCVCDLECALACVSVWCRWVYGGGWEQRRGSGLAHLDDVEGLLDVVGPQDGVHGPLPGRVFRHLPRNPRLQGPSPSERVAGN